MRMRIFGQKIITAGLLIGLLTWLFLLPEGFVDDAVGCFPPPCLTCPPCWTGCYCNHYNPGCPTCDSSKCLCCRDCQCYFQCPYDKACIVEITGHDLCYEGCHYNTIGTGSMNGTYTLQPYGDECDWGAVYPSNLTLTLFYDVNHPYCPNPPNTEPCTCVYLPSAPGILVFHFHCWGSSAFLYIYDINPINPDTEEGDEIFRGGTNSVTNCIECTISDSNPVFCPNGHWASPTAKITVNSDPTCASCCPSGESCCNGECYDTKTQQCCYGNVCPSTQWCCNVDQTCHDECVNTEPSHHCDTTHDNDPENICPGCTGGILETHCMDLRFRVYTGNENTNCNGGCPGECARHDVHCYTEYKCREQVMRFGECGVVEGAPGGLGCEEAGTSMWCIPCHKDTDFPGEEIPVVNRACGY